MEVYEVEVTKQRHLPLTQCAAVTTQRSAISEPPQKCFFSFLFHRLTCQGCEPRSARRPPIILARVVNVGLPQSGKREKKRRKEGRKEEEKGRKEEEEEEEEGRKGRKERKEGRKRRREGSTN